jgi:PPM family protein phosphatase
LSLKQQRDVTTVLERMTDRFLQIDSAVRSEADNDYTLQGMGTTLTVAAVLGSNLFIGHVGDSRAYLLRGSNLRQLTTDHTLAQALIDAGVADPDDPASRSMRHVLTAAVGSLGREVDPQVQRFRLERGDQLLLCTDGLTETVSDSTIAHVLQQAASVHNACGTLVDLALAGGGNDNITVVAAKFGSSEL